VSWGRAAFRRIRDLVPVSGFVFNRPIVIFQSDDWGRVGLRDREGFEQLQAAGLALGDRPYDFYTLETSDDLVALGATLKKHRDSMGCHPCVEMNFILGNLDFARMEAEQWQTVHIRPLANGLPNGWERPGLLEAYHSGIAYGVFHAALHGMTHFCQRAVQRNLEDDVPARLLRTLWKAGTPYIHWRMPWIGYEYWDPENPPDERFLSQHVQRKLIGETVGAFAKMFATLPTSACAPGYRSNEDTIRAWAQHGVKVAQNGPGTFTPPYFNGSEVLQLSRTIEFEPAVQADFSLEACLCAAETCFSNGIPAIVSVHSINFHSSVRDFRTQTLKQLDSFLKALETRHSDLLYLHDADLYELVQNGRFRTRNGVVQVEVQKKKIKKANAVTKKVV